MPLGSGLLAIGSPSLEALPGEAPEARVAVSAAVGTKEEKSQGQLIPRERRPKGGAAKTIVAVKHGAMMALGGEQQLPPRRSLLLRGAIQQQSAQCPQEEGEKALQEADLATAMVRSHVDKRCGSLRAEPGEVQRTFVR